jgi:hypothetical protein
MTKGTKLGLFVLGATIFNLLVTALLFIALIFLYSITLGRMLPPESILWAIVVSFLASMVGGILVYKKTLSWARVKYGLDEKLGIPDAKR